MKSPIDSLIDEACGLTLTDEVRWITLRCPECQLTKQVIRHVDDPPDEVVGNCPDCIEDE